jgi:diguanylate cyclase
MRRLTLLVTVAAVPAGGLIVWALFRAHSQLSPDLVTALLIFGVVVPNTVTLMVRIRATEFSVSPTSAAVLVCAAYVSPAKAILYTAVGTLIAKLVLRKPPIKLTFGVAKETLAVAGAAAALSLGGFVRLADTPPTTRSLPMDAVMLALAALMYTVVDELISGLVLSTASGTTMRKFLVVDWDIRFLIRLGSCATAIVVLALANEQGYRALLVLPVLVYGLHLTSSIRIRARAEREAWQRLAQATDEFNAVDLDGVLRTAVLRAGDLFSVHEIEVEILDPPRLVRGDSAGVKYDGPPDKAPPSIGQAIPIDLAVSVEQESLGELRLIVRGGEITLSERENYTLSTFAAALCTAIRNASTHAETKRLAESHARAAAIDPLTGLPNRRRLHEYAATVLTGNSPETITALLLIDLNHFKEINDTLGHSAGDQVLIEIGQRLAASAQPDDLVARLGGDEFAILLVGLAAPALVVSRAHALLATLNPPMDLDGVRVSIEACGGVALASSESDIGELLRQADVAMYEAKRHGQRVTVFASARDTADVGSLALGGDLARAIAEGEFMVNFQPIVDLGSGEVIAAEALTRWNHPRRGDLAPGRFLGSIERSAQLPAFAGAVLDQALVAAASWREAGFDLSVAVNVSPRSLLDKDFPEAVATSLAAYDVPPAALVIELTESVTLSQLEVVDDVLKQLREVGVRLALDDFGTGYSSLATLARVPVHELKIDRSFVAALDSPTEAAVVRSTIELGRSLDLLVVAEGVENDRQRARLWELGCPTGQGHLFARPMPAERLLAALQRGHGGRPGTLAAPLHEAGSVIRIPPNRRARGQQSAEGSG